jgi:hypothetical protein
MFALVKSLVQIAGTKKANGMQRNLPKSLQNLHLTGKKKEQGHSLIKLYKHVFLVDFSKRLLDAMNDLSVD